MLDLGNKKTSSGSCQKKKTERLSKNSMASLFLAIQDSSIGDLVSD